MPPAALSSMVLHRTGFRTLRANQPTTAHVFQLHDNWFPCQVQIYPSHGPTIIQTQRLPIICLQGVHATLPRKRNMLCVHFLRGNDILPRTSDEHQILIASLPLAQSLTTSERNCQRFRSANTLTLQGKSARSPRGTSGISGTASQEPRKKRDSLGIVVLSREFSLRTIPIVAFSR